MTKAVNAALFDVETAIREAKQDSTSPLFIRCFNALVDMVEVKKAAKEERFALEYDHFYEGSRCGFLWLKRRAPKAGMAYLRFESSLKNTPEELNAHCKLSLEQRASAAKEALALYTWWTQERAMRPSPLEVSGLAELARKIKEREASGVKGCEHTDDYGNGTCNSCLMNIAMAQSRAKDAIYQYQLEDSKAFMRLEAIPVSFSET